MKTMIPQQQKFKKNIKKEMEISIQNQNHVTNLIAKC